MTSVSSHAPYDHVSPLLTSPSHQRREKLGPAQGIFLAAAAGIVAWTFAITFTLSSIR